MKRSSIEPVNDDTVTDIEKNLPLDDKMFFNDKNAEFFNDMNNTICDVEETSMEIQWKNFHRCKSRITFVLQFIAVISVQGIIFLILLGDRPFSDDKFSPKFLTFNVYIVERVSIDQP